MKACKYHTVRGHTVLIYRPGVPARVYSACRRWSQIFARAANPSHGNALVGVGGAGREHGEHKDELEFAP